MIKTVLIDIAKRALLIGVVLSVIVIAMGHGHRLPGFFVGMAIGLVNLSILARDASSLVSDGLRARNKMVRNYFIRYVAMAAILIAYCGVLKGSIGACFLGLIVVQASTFWTGAWG